MNSATKAEVGDTLSVWFVGSQDAAANVETVITLASADQLVTAAAFISVVSLASLF